jgi:hypothetical protein
MAVCLHCLHADRVAARDRRQRAIMRFMLWTVSLAVVGVVGAAGAGAVGRQPPPANVVKPTPKPVTPTVVVAVRDSVAPAAAAPAIELQGAPAIELQGAPVTRPLGAPDSAARPPVAVTPPAPAVVHDSVPPPAPVFGPIIGQGRTDLPDSLFAVRRGETVVVNFDTGPARTRRADKFEAIVRQTLHAIYGPIADTLLAAVPAGKLAGAKELVTTLPTRGIHLQGPHGPRLALWPQTRAGRDGQLVVAYRTRVER